MDILLMFFGMVAFIVFSVWAAISALRKNGKVKRYLLVSGVCLLFFLIGLFIPKSDTTPNNTGEESKVVKFIDDTEITSAGKSPDYSDDDIQLAHQFDKTIAEIEKEARPYEIEGAKILDEILNAKVDNFEAYSELRRIKDQYDLIGSELRRIVIPKDLSADLKINSENIRDKLTSYYYYRSVAFDYLMKLIDDPKPSYMDEAVKNLELSLTFKKQVSTEFSLLYSKIGIPDDLRTE